MLNLETWKPIISTFMVPIVAGMILWLWKLDDRQREDREAVFKRELAYQEKYVTKKELEELKISINARFTKLEHLSATNHRDVILSLDKLQEQIVRERRK